MKKTTIFLAFTLVFFFVSYPVLQALGEPTDTVTDKTRCSVCGMFVAKYPNWLAQIQYSESTETLFFDGPKDMMAFYFAPEQYGGRPQEKIKDMYVKDYYSLKWLSAKDAYYVIGSDIYGPMGHELIPFENKEAADSFLKDHHGKEILTFDSITPELIESLREGQRMR